MSPTTNASKYVVIGAGLAGAATAWQLARRGHEVTIVERSHPANDAGSSHGSARIFRYAYPDEFYTGLVQQAKTGWDELARLGGTPLITSTGSVDYGADRNPAQLTTILEARGIEHELLSAAEAGSRWPQIAFDTPVPGMQVYGLPGGRDADFHGQKVAEYNGGKRLPSAADQDGLMDPTNRARVVDYVSRYLPGVVPEPYAQTTCLFTNTPTEDFILDRVDGITLLSPCSGHGATFAPEIGRLAADLATGAGEVPAQFRLAGLAAAGRARS